MLLIFLFLLSPNLLPCTKLVATSVFPTLAPSPSSLDLEESPRWALGCWSLGQRSKGAPLRIYAITCEMREGMSATPPVEGDVAGARKFANFDWWSGG